METQVKPIKRSRQLAPLSREHHDGLLFVWKLQKGLNNHTEIENLRNFCNWYWKQHINPHIGQEEHVLLQYIPSDHVLGLQLKKEHNEIRDLILAIDNNPDVITIEVLADFLYKHIRFEERVVFPYLEEMLSEVQLDVIHHQLDDQSICTIEWNDEFWMR